ncbi:dipeptide epimerase [Altererythrobacter sp. Root672]|uniref:dipeptide epimerase n=1 Tax=Altererythrobacter sp. Root672 TaxID=1736584 RepID=UPI0006FFFA1B|nr:dipeptide epimerase [Altererythrobacter sp. Root672]KRA82648.1 mandelate racemase [Altererythrobacter sp. Root672]
MRRRLTLREERFAFREPFHISGHKFTETKVLVAEIAAGDSVGLGEGAGVYYLGDDLAHMRDQAESARVELEAGADRAELQSLLPPGGARNALDCALWDLEARTVGVPVWQLAGLGKFDPLPTTMTISADAPVKMAEVAAGRFGDWPMLKLKLTGDVGLDADRVRSVRRARPDAWLGVDANQGYTADNLGRLVEILLEAKVELLEQPLARGAEQDLDDLSRPLPFAADESVCTLTEVEQATGRFDAVNIKLDKCGGLTEALAIARRCRELGLQVMVGNMMGSSLSMAPSLVVGQLCDIVDLDGPTFLASDRPGSIRYFDGKVDAGTADWGLLATLPR